MIQRPCCSRIMLLWCVCSWWCVGLHRVQAMCDASMTGDVWSNEATVASMWVVLGQKRNQVGVADLT